MKARSAWRTLLGMLALGGAFVACSSFQSSGGAASKTTETDAGAEASVVEPAVDAAVDAEPAPPDAGAAPFVRGFSKTSTLANLPNGNGQLTVLRPPGTQAGDTLVLFTLLDSTGGLDETPFPAPTLQGQCPYTNAVYFGFTSRLDDGTASYTFMTGTEHDIVELLLVAVAGGPVADFETANDYFDGGAPAVTVQSDQGLVLLAFTALSSPQSEAPTTDGLSFVTDVTGADHTIQLYAGVFPKGRTAIFGPYSTAMPCWGAMTVELPPNNSGA